MRSPAIFMEDFIMSKIIELRNKRNALWEQT